MIQLPRRLVLATFAGVLSVAAVPASAADAVASFYKGKTINIIVGYGPGGGYDLYARLMARHLPKHIPGNPTVVVQNMPGAGSLKATNHVYNVAKADGTNIAAMNAVLPFQPLISAKAARYDVVKAHWMPVPATPTAMVSVWHTVPVNSFLEMRKRVTLFGGAGPASAPAYYSRVLNEVFKTKMKIINGYRGSKNIFLAVERGELEGHASASYTSVSAGHGKWLKEGKLKLLLQYGAKKHAAIPNVPFGNDLAKGKDNKALLDLATASTKLGRPYMLAPKVPMERVVALRKAFMAAYRDPALLAEAKKLKLPISPRSGEEVEATIKAAYGAPEPVVKRLQSLYVAKKKKKKKK